MLFAEVSGELELEWRAAAGVVSKNRRENVEKTEKKIVSKKEKAKFQSELKKNFKTLIERFACGKQELYSLCTAERLEKKYTRAFLELFESGYAPHVGDVERISGKRVIKLFVTLPNNYAD